MRLLHTSDWHLGARLHGQSRTAEFENLMEWMLGVIRDNSVDVLVVSGDIFDSSVPGSGNQGLYYRFLASLVATCCRNVVIIAGNHDSPSLISASEELLRLLNIYVVGAARENPEDEVVTLHDGAGNAMAVVAAVPYLREGDVRLSEAGEGAEAKLDKYATGIASHYDRVCTHLHKVRQEAVALARGRHVPAVVTGHLYVIGSQDSESEHKLYVGNLGGVDGGMFPEWVDYVALGHLHKPQRIGDRQNFRYSGSPLQLGFDAADQNRFVYLVDFPDVPGMPPDVAHIQVPVWQKLGSVHGKSWDEIERALTALKSAGESIWIDVHYEGDHDLSDLAGRVHAAVDDSCVQALRIHDHQRKSAVMLAKSPDEKLEDLEPVEVFRRRLAATTVLPDDQAALEAMFDEILYALRNRDGSAEPSPGDEGGAR
ncbi:MAG TPA: exonuclease SbcCD subunit D C-terminal domain-containing protein [Myxococcota bacterium]|nr:exonuclease SbcCD subunit D C-terminal domain-containing protein [Myxococcota bacterium]HOD00062.1 exonuclease SbcCD subunit D C-terminal domain-containing protein [Myxococcota bacterium]HOH77443.1 exonuclease SbcCD subunit D C-terminal domain-containing protein [Myxococcota bacterium]HPV04883.1 exonuclease SbcCD subunit D C-terminal domain-containing protein [Myxococcota bacterium]